MTGKRWLGAIMAVIVAAAAGLLGRAHYRLQELAGQLANGLEWRLGQMTIVVPPVAHPTRAWLPPALRLGDLTLTVQLGPEQPLAVPLTAARLQAQLWPKGLCLQSAHAGQTSDPAAPAPTTRVAADDLTICLTAEDTVSAITIGSVTWTQSVASAEGADATPQAVTTTWRAVQMTHRASEAFVPTYAGLELGEWRTEWTEGGAPWSVVVRSPRLQWASRPGKTTTARREATLQAHWSGIELRRPDKPSLEVLPFDLTVDGTVPNQPMEPFRARMAEVWGQLQPFLNDAVSGEAQVRATADLIDAVIGAWTEYGLWPTTYGLSLEGMRATAEGGRPIVTLGPAQTQGTIREAPEGLGVEATYGLKEIAWTVSDGPGHGALRDLTATASYRSRYTTYLELFEAQRRQYRSLFEAVEQAGRDPEQLSPDAPWRDSFALYPRGMSSEARIGALQYEGNTGERGEYRDVHALYAFDGEGGKAELQGTVVRQTLPQGFPEPEWTDGAASLAVDVRWPWDRGDAAPSGDGKSPGGMIARLFFQPLGATIALTARGGNLGFDAATTLAAKADLSTMTFTPEEQQQLARGGELDWEALRPRLMSEALRHGHLRFDLTIEHLQRLKAVINAISAGAGDMAAGMAQSYAEVDAEKDALKLSITYDQGQVQASGALQPLLEQVLGELLPGQEQHSVIE